RIVDLPQRGEDGARTRVLERTSQADETLSAHLFAEPGFARRQGHEVRVDPNLFENLPGLQQAVVLPLLRPLRDRKGECRVERETFVDVGVTGVVDQWNVAPDRDCALLRRLLAEEGLRSRRVEAGDRFDFLARAGKRLEPLAATQHRAQL